jgi:hypothetical protein
VFWGVLVLVESVFVDSGSLVVGSLCSGASVQRLVVCPHSKRVSCGVSPHFWGFEMCCLDSQHCGSRGRRFKFRLHVGGFFTVFWVCPKLVGLSKVVV